MVGIDEAILPPARETMTAAVDRFKEIPWCAKLVDDPEWIPCRTGSRIPKSSTEDSFFAETLGTNRTIRCLLSMRPRELDSEEPAIRRVQTLVELGDGLNGHPQICHGGFVATMLDEICGVLISLNRERQQGITSDEPHEQFGLFTAYLKTNYRKPVPTPGVILCTARFERKERNKTYVEATVESGDGTIYATGEALFIEPKSKI